MYTRSTVMGFALLVLLFLGTGATATPLDDYVAKPDSAYSWEVRQVVDGGSFKDYVLRMNSQNWLTSDKVDRTLWEHDMVITVPNTVTHSTALMFVEGGNKYSSPPYGNPYQYTYIAVQTQSVVARVRQIPNEPLTFAGQPSNTEDGLIAYGWKQFTITGDPEWLMQLPMTKAVVRAMDTVTAFCAQPAYGGRTVNSFVVAGASKRGWTTWTTGIADPRVIGIAPCVIDVLNMSRSLTHHFDAVGFYSDQVYDYYYNNITDMFNTPELGALEAIVDPYSYRHRLTIPKYIISGSQDEYFLPDSGQFYVHELEGDTKVRYVPSAGHGLDGSVYYTLLGWYWTLLNNVQRPEFTWVKRHDGSLEIDTGATAPATVKLWQSTNPNERLFFLDYAYATYTSSILNPVAPGKYIAQVDPPASGFTAFFAELTYNVGGPQPLVFTTEISVVPDVLPFGPKYSFGSSEDLLDAAFYAGEASDGSDVAGRGVVLGEPSHDGRRVAFWALNLATDNAGLFVANVGDPSSWRRIAADGVGYSLTRIAWTPDDSALLVGGTRVAVPAPGALAVPEPLLLDGIAPQDTAMTALQSDNWAFTVDDLKIVAVPVMPNGIKDATRQSVILTNFADLSLHPAWLSTTPDGSSVAFTAQYAVAPDPGLRGDVYRLRNLADILAAPTVGATRVSTLAPDSLTDDNIVPLRSSESDNYAGMASHTAEDGFGAVAVFGEDWNNAFDPIAIEDSYNNGDFDIMVSNTHGYEADQRLQADGQQFVPRLTEGGPRLVCTHEIDGVPHLYAAPLKVTYPLSGAGNEGDAENIVKIRHKQELCDGSGLYAPIYGNDYTLSKYDFSVGPTTNVTFPAAVSRRTANSEAYDYLTFADISIETPVNPVPADQIPDGIAGLPVVRVMEPAEVTFDPALTLTIKYTDREVAGLEEAQLRVFRFNAAESRFSEEISVVSRDLDANTLTINLAKLGTYAVGAVADPDVDDDGMLDAWEIAHGLNPGDPTDATADADGDGLNNKAEFDLGADPNDVDTDDDGCDDGFEVVRGMNPASKDSDGDTFADGDELALGTDPIAAGSHPQLVIGTNRYDVSSVLTISKGASRFDRRTGNVTVTVTVTSPAGFTLPIPAPLAGIVASVNPTNIPVAVSNGTTLTGQPYVNIAGSALSDGKLSPGESCTFDLSFRNPSNKRFTFDVAVAGALARIQP